MNKIKFTAIFMIIVIALLGFRFFIFSERSISDKEITSDIEKQINRILKENHRINPQNIGAKVELFEDIQSKRFVVYSFVNPLAGYMRHTGYAVYERTKDGRFKRTDFGWDSSTLNVRNLTVHQNDKDMFYLMVYGMNDPGKKQIYEYTSGSDKEIVEFSGDYFLKKYDTNGNPAGFRNIQPDSDNDEAEFQNP